MSLQRAFEVLVVAVGLVAATIPVRAAPVPAETVPAEPGPTEPAPTAPGPTAPGPTGLGPTGLEHVEIVPGGRYGDVRVTRPTGTMHGFVVLFSALSGWSDADQLAADLLARHAVLVVGVDTARYVAALAAAPEACHGLVSDAEMISHQLQRELGSDAYFTPILAGTGEGGTLAEHVLSMAASNTITGAISIDPAPTLDARFAPCPPDPTILHDPGLPGFWAIGSTTTLPDATQALATTLQGVGATVAVRGFAPDATEADILLALAQPHLGPRAPDEQDVADLPLVELPAEHRTNMLAIVVSGDGGWRDLDQTIARNLQQWGVSVVGMDSLRYFWRNKTPDQTAHDLARVIQTYTRRWHAKSVALIGYSFGADVLPFAYNRLPAPVRDKVTMLSLLGFAPSADFEIRVGGWLGMPPSADALPARPEIDRVPSELVQCFYGEDETDTLCPRLANTGVVVIRTGGSHHFGHDYAHLAQVILNGWRRRMTKG
jgi:type IV secretory pathway VirJ component